MAVFIVKSLFCSGDFSFSGGRKNFWAMAQTGEFWLTRGGWQTRRVGCNPINSRKFTTKLFALWK